jgi:glutamyl-Q tRNA(Asp) synthetase
MTVEELIDCFPGPEKSSQTWFGGIVYNAVPEDFTCKHWFTDSALSSHLREISLFGGERIFGDVAGTASPAIAAVFAPTLPQSELVPGYVEGFYGSLAATWVTLQAAPGNGLFTDPHPCFHEALRIHTSKVLSGPILNLATPFKPAMQPLNIPLTGSAAVRGRIAPTPSGFLHLGNGVNFLLTWLMVRNGGGVLKLRIDDADSPRVRPEYVEDIFRQLDWLGLDWDEGPAGPDDFSRNHSQLLRLSRYRQVLAELTEHLFFCTCSRSRIRAHSAGNAYPGTCRGLTEPPAGEYAIRIRVPEELSVETGGILIGLGRRLGDFVLWRKNDLPAYQLASLVDDLDDHMNLIVRGSDLLESTAAQLFLAGRLRGATFLTARFHHHSLITAPEGRKLSKSDQSLSLAAMRENGVSPVLVYRETARLLGLEPAVINSLDDLVAGSRLSHGDDVLKEEKGSGAGLLPHDEPREQREIGQASTKCEHLEKYLSCSKP